MRGPCHRRPGFRPPLVAITGSTRAGKAVAAPNVAGVHLELGGNAPVIVLDDADMAATARDIAVAGFFNTGQDCTTAMSVLAHESIASELATALAEAAGAGRFSSAEDVSDTLFIPPLNNAAQRDKFAELVARAPAHAKVLTGGTPAEGPGHFFPPTVVSELRQDDELVREETFEPLITVPSFTDKAEALRLANDTDYGVAYSVWTGDRSRARRMSGGLEFGCVWVNCHIPLVAEMPRGGFNQSGYGTDLSAYSVEEYTRVKHVMTRYV